MRIGLTGGIASGKSTVADLFAALGVRIVDTDIIAREVVEPGQPALGEIAEGFGAGVLCADGSLDRRALRKVVFADDAKRRRLEAILHPRIRAETAHQSAQAKGPYHIVVVPLLVESPMRGDMERVLVVDCGEDTQLSRLTARDGISEAQARQMIAAQASREERLAIADDVIVNDGDLASVREDVHRLHQRYLSLAGDSSGSSPETLNP